MRDLVLIGGVAVAMLLAVPFADVANPDYPEASAIAERLNAACRSVWSGGVSIEEAASAEYLVVYQYPAEEGTVSVLTHAQPTAAGTCYGMRMTTVCFIPALVVLIGCVVALATNIVVELLRR